MKLFGTKEDTGEAEERISRGRDEVQSMEPNREKDEGQTKGINRVWEGPIDEK